MKRFFTFLQKTEEGPADYAIVWVGLTCFILGLILVIKASSQPAVSQLLISGSKTSHDALFSFYNDKLQTVRSGKWKLHINSPESAQLPSGPEWIDPRLPDGVTILAPFEQPKANQFPGIKTGDAPAAGLLFDLENDPSEQHNVAAEHLDIVKTLQSKVDVYLQREKVLQVKSN